MKLELELLWSVSSKYSGCLVGDVSRLGLTLLFADGDGVGEGCSITGLLLLLLVDEGFGVFSDDSELIFLFHVCKPRPTSNIPLAILVACRK